MSRFVSSAIVLLMCFLTAPIFAAEGPAQQQDLSSLDLESLLNIKVTTVSKFSENLADAPGVISIITRDELKRFGAMTLREVLERVPSLVRSSAYFTDRSLVAARGDQTKIDGGHILMLINGRPSREVLEGGLITDLLESFPVGILERIEVIKGPGSVLYGSNAFSAVINLITQKADGDGWVLSSFGGEKGALASSGQGMFQHGGVSVIGAAQVRHEPNWSAMYRSPFVDSTLSAPSAMASMTSTLRDRSHGAYVQLDYKGFTAMSTFTEWHGASFVRGLAGENRWRRGFGDLGYELKASNKWDMKFDLTYTRNTLDVPDYPNIGRDSNEIVLEWTNTIKPTSKDQLTIGSLYNHVQGSELYFGITPSITISHGSRSGAAIYAQLDHQLRDDVKLIGGLQANKITGIDVDVVPRAGIVWKLTNQVNVKALYSQAFRAPSLNETGLNHPGLQGWPGLVPEKVGTADLGINYQSRRMQVGVNYFHSKQTDSIIVDTNLPRWRYANLGEATFQGVEFEGKYYLTRTFFLEGSMLYQTNHDDKGNGNITPVPHSSAKMGFSYEAENGITASIFDSYQQRIPGYASTVNPVPTSYHLLNSHFKFDVSRHLWASDAVAMSFVVHANNLTNKQVWLPDWGGGSGDTIPVVRGRTVYFGFEISQNSK